MRLEMTARSRGDQKLHRRRRALHRLRKRPRNSVYHFDGFEKGRQGCGNGGHSPHLRGSLPRAVSHTYDTDACEDCLFRACRLTHLVLYGRGNGAFPRTVVMHHKGQEPRKRGLQTGRVKKRSCKAEQICFM